MEQDGQAEQQQLDRDRAQRGRELLNAMVFARQVQDFLDGPVGQRMIADSEAERARLIESYFTHDPETEAGRLAMRNVKQRIGVLDHWQELFATYLHAGTEAATEFDEGEYELPGV